MDGFAKKCSAAIFCLAVLLFLAAYAVVPALADSVGDYEFASGADNVTITAYIGSGGTVSIPEEIAGKPVTAIAEYAFSECAALVSVTIPSTVTIIGDGAFAYCDNLTDIAFEGDTLGHIGKEAFCGTPWLESQGDSVVIGDIFYLYQGSAKSVTVPDGITEISNYAFFKCETVQAVTLPDSLTRIGDYAFFMCESLVGITISKNVTYIGDSAFDKCLSMRGVTLPDNLAEIGDYAFQFCRALESIIFPSGLRSIGNSAFWDCENLENVIFFNGTTHIGDYAFRYCSALESVTLPATLETIGCGAFYECVNLNSVTFAGSITTLSEKLFYGCGTLDKVSLPATLEVIESDVFLNCDNLDTIYYMGDGEQWTRVKIEDESSAVSQALVRYVSPYDAAKVDREAKAAVEALKKAAETADTADSSYDEIDYDGITLSGGVGVVLFILCLLPFALVFIICLSLEHRRGKHSE